MCGVNGVINKGIEKEKGYQIVLLGTCTLYVVIIIRRVCFVRSKPVRRKSYNLHVHAYMYICKSTCVHACVYACVHVYMYMYIIYMYMITCTSTFVHAYMYAYIQCTCIHVHCIYIGYRHTTALLW